MEAQLPMGLKGDSGDGDVQSYQFPSKVQGEAGHACERRMKCVHGAVREEMKCAQVCTGVHGGTWVSATWDARCTGSTWRPSHQ